MSPASDATLRSEIRWAAGRAFTDPLRMRVLFGGGPADALALATFLSRIVPAARKRISTLAERAQRIPNAALRAKALHGLRAKGYHIAGASVFAAFLGGEARDRYLRLTAPLETIYDFLDTVGDTHPVPDAHASQTLHLALADALDPTRTTADYFEHMSGRDDGGYLATLVQDVRAELRPLLTPQIAARLRDAAALYARTQTLKHLPPQEREAACKAAFAEPSAEKDVTWFEYAAAAGSQFQVYAPLFLALAGAGDPAAAYDAYFPEAAGIHVLLDAFIDRDEDRRHGELNWLDCYADENVFEERLKILARRAARKLSHLGMHAAHLFTLRLMMVFYLTHPKVWQQRLTSPARRLLRIAAAETT